MQPGQRLRHCKMVWPAALNFEPPDPHPTANGYSRNKESRRQSEYVALAPKFRPVRLHRRDLSVDRAVAGGRCRGRCGCCPQLGAVARAVRDGSGPARRSAAAMGRTQWRKRSLEDVDTRPRTFLPDRVGRSRISHDRGAVRRPITAAIQYGPWYPRWRTSNAPPRVCGPSRPPPRRRDSLAAHGPQSAAA